MGEQAELLNLHTDNAVLRRAKRPRPDSSEHQVFDLADSDDDSPISRSRPVDGAEQGADRRQAHPRIGSLWGALQDQDAGARGALGRPIYRPPSARLRRLPLNPRPNTVPSPIVIDDEEDDGDDALSPQQRPPLRQPHALLQAAGGDAPAADPFGLPAPLAQRLQLRGLASGIQAGAAATNASSAASGGHLHPQPQQEPAASDPSQPQQQQGAPPPPPRQQQQQWLNPLLQLRRVPLQLPQPSQMLGWLGFPADGSGGGDRGEGASSAAAVPAAAGLQGGTAAAGGESTNGSGPSSSSPQARHHPAGPRLASSFREAAGRGEELRRESSLRSPLQQRLQRYHELQQQRRLRQEQEDLLRRRQQQQQQQQQESREQQEQGQAGRKLDPAEQEEEDKRLAARLQAEEDERAAREAARRLETDELLAREEVERAEQEEHRRMMNRLDALETLEATSQAAAGRAMRAAGGRRANRAAAERALAREELFDRELEVDFMDMMRAARYARTGGGGAAGAAADQASHLPWLAGPGAAAARSIAAAAAAAADAGSAAAGGGGGGSGAGAGARAGAGGRAAAARWSGRALHEMMFPGMAFAMGIPYGLARAMADEEGGPGAGAARDIRRNRYVAFREHERAVREQLAAAQRAGLPPSLLLSDRDFTPEDYEMLCRLDDKVENRKGAREEQLASLEELVVGSEGRRQSDGSVATCVVCMDELAPGAVVKRLYCKHEFHSDCLDTWLKIKACCPVCQRDLD
ncbi:hypothetical protein Agub_g15723 [Astrephomene gubernaculifera]|uniref:RING-type domain-containing protein n=1 Tax=Astrephomene gubernaculifera TaxID=47775 RepID=A0AAD3HU46_9CHLO|nr:hypothetical protein Agub_g15723 [Astrephomene gubernaculifera]